MAHIYDVSGTDLTYSEERETGTEDRFYENVGGIERVVSAILGGALLLRSVIKPTGLGSRLAGLFGLSLLYRSASGHCAAYEALGVNTAKRGAYDS